MPALLTICFVLSGAAGLIYESIWSRYLGLFVGHSAYAQVIVLVIYLGGMSAGAALAARRSEKIKEPLIGYAAIEVAVGLLGLFFHEIYQATTAFAYSSIFPALAGGWALVSMKWALAALLILPQSVLLGMTFPLMTSGYLRRVSRDGKEQSGRVVGVLYFANSLGAAAGVLIAGFYLIGIVGLPGTILTAAIINIVVGLAVYGAARMSPDEMDTFGVLRPPEPSDAPPEPAAAPAYPGSIAAESATAAVIPAVAAMQLPMLWRVLLTVAAGTALSSTPEIAAQLAQFFAPVEAVKFAAAAPAPALEELRAEAAQILAALEGMRIGT